MNLFQLQENLKNFSQDQLVNEMRNPTGTAPQYLILSELQRRRRIMQEEQAQMPQQQTTVAEDAVAASGVPQGGIAQMAQALAPQTDTVMNTAAQPVERMREGGMLGNSMPMTTDGQQFNAMLQNGPLGSYHEYLTETYAEPRINNFVGRVQQMEQREFGRGAGIQPLGFGPVSQPGYQPLPQPIMARIPNQMPYDTISGAMLGRATNQGPENAMQPPLQLAEGGEVRRMDVGGRATGLAAINRNLADFMPMRRGARGNRFMNLTPDTMGAGIAVDALIADPRVQAAATTSNMSPEEYISALDSEQFQNALDMLNTPVENAPLRDEGRLSDEEFMASRYDGPGGAYSVTERSGAPGRARLSEAGLTGVEPTPTVSAEDIRRMANENRIDESADGFSVIGAGIAGPYTEFLERMAETPLFPERRGMQFGETPIGAIQSERTEEPMDETLQRILANSEAAIARDTAAVPAFADRRAPDFVTAMPSPARATLPVDEARARRTAAYVEENLARDAAGLPERERVGMSDRAMAAQMDGPFDVDVTAEDVLAGVNAMYPDQSMSANELANLELQGFDDTDQSGDPGYGFGDMARDIFGDAAIDEIIRNREIGRERERTRDAASRFETEAEAADAEIAALDREALAAQFEAEGEVADAEQRLPVVDLTEQREGSGGGAGGGAGGAGSGMSSDDLYNQDKWLALAQVGLSLMSSRAPTFGEALGQAGQTGIAALMQARGDRQDRIEAAQARADRLAAAAARAARDDSERYPYRQIDDIIGLADSYQGQADAIIEALGGVPNEGDPEYQDYINNLALANTYRNYAREAIGIQ